MPEPLLIVGVVLLVVGIPLVIALTAETDRKEWTRYARARGWQYTPSNREVVADLNLEPFGRGNARTARHLVVGSHRGVPVRAFGYEYTTGSGDEATTHRFAVVQFVSAASLPDLEVYRGWRLRLSRHVRFADERFARAFDVRSPDRDFAHRVVHPGFIAALLDGALGECHLVLERGVFTVWRPGSLRVGQVDDMLDQLVTVLDLIPARVWADGRVEPPPIVPRPASAGEPGA